MNLEDILWNEKSQAQKDKYLLISRSDLTSMGNLTKQNTQSREGVVAARGQGVGEGSLHKPKECN